MSQRLETFTLKGGPLDGQEIRAPVHGEYGYPEPIVRVETGKVGETVFYYRRCFRHPSGHDRYEFHPEPEPEA